MIEYVGKRILLMVPVLLGVVLIVFTMTRLSPGDPARMLAGNDASEEAVEALREELGLEVSARVETRAGEDGVPVPWSAELTGPRTEALASYLETELGIPAERQVWHERNTED